MKDPIKPTITTQRTNAAMSTQSYTYNEVGLTYNSFIEYGGLYKHDVVPIISSITTRKTISVASDTKPALKIERTQARVQDTAYTYNEADLTYNSDIVYGGLYGYDIVPIVSLIHSLYPSITHARDFEGIVIPPSPPSGMTGMPMGLLLALTYAT